mmetsp:Transcript_13819/g.32577  ORF Transcript_13819/g.32577 Transcript_13819/m.32577 type:complete len:204 (+) Transcript_13819:1726-2337(+)
MSCAKKHPGSVQKAFLSPLLFLVLRVLQQLLGFAGQILHSCSHCQLGWIVYDFTNILIAPSTARFRLINYALVHSTLQDDPQVLMMHSLLPGNSQQLTLARQRVAHARQSEDRRFTGSRFLTIDEQRSLHILSGLVAECYTACEEILVTPSSQLLLGRVPFTDGDGDRYLHCNQDPEKHCTWLIPPLVITQLTESIRRQQLNI